MPRAYRPRPTAGVGIAPRSPGFVYDKRVLGNGSLFGLPLFGSSFEPWVVMVLPPGGFLMLGLILLLFSFRLQRRAAATNR